MFTDEWLAELRSKNDILDVVSGYVTLTKRGANYWASCPFHPERMPSFSVNPDKQMFYCFSCKRGGDVVRFIRDVEKLDFHEAVAFLADRVGMELPVQEGSGDYQKKRDYKKRLHGMMKEAAGFYHEKLKSPEGKEALEYLNKRGAGSMIVRYGLGYAPDGFQNLVNFLQEKGYTKQEMLDAGVVRQKEGRIYDTFRNRAVFPIIDIMGNVIGFGGRVMGEGEPKYLNSPENLIFNKRLNLYGLNLVRKQRDLRSILLVEGYMDVVSLAAAGIRSAVASLGTSLTKEQARLIKRYVSEVYLCYDGDHAGIQAALRGVDVLEAEGLRVRVLSLPEGQDPDDFVRANGSAGIYEQAKKALGGFEFKLEQLRKEYDMSVPDQVVEYCTKAAAQIAVLKNPVQRERFTRLVSQQTGISEQSIAQQAHLDSASAGDLYNNREKVLNFTKKEPGNEAKLISLLVENADLLTACCGDLEAEDFAVYSGIFSYIQTQIKRGILPVSAEIISSTDVDLSELMACTLPEGTMHKGEYARMLALRVKIDSLRRQIERINRQAAVAQGAQRLECVQKVQKLTAQINALQEQLNRG